MGRPGSRRVRKGKRRTREKNGPLRSGHGQRNILALVLACLSFNVFSFSLSFFFFNSRKDKTEEVSVKNFSGHQKHAGGINGGRISGTKEKDLKR